MKTINPLCRDFLSDKFSCYFFRGKYWAFFYTEKCVAHSKISNERSNKFRTVFFLTMKIYNDVSLPHMQSILVMSPSRAGSNHSSSWRIFSSARLVTFFASARMQKLAKNEPKIGRKWAKIQFSVEDLFLINFHNKLG